MNRTVHASLDRFKERAFTAVVVSYDDVGIAVEFKSGILEFLEISYNQFLDMHADILGLKNGGFARDYRISARITILVSLPLVT